MRILTAVAAALVLIALLPAAARAQGPPVAAATPVPSPAPPPVPSPAPPPASPPGPAAGRLSVGLDRVIRDGRRSLVLAGDGFRVRGQLKPYVAGQRVVVRVYRGSRKIAVKGVSVRPAKRGGAGVFTATFKASRPGPLAVRAVHRATPELASLRARSARLRVVRPVAGPGASGPVVRLLQAGLHRMAYAVSRSGVYDDATARAVMAYRKVNGMARTGIASRDFVRRVLRRHGAFKPRHGGAGRHLEADLSRQVLALVEGRRVVRTYHTSTGAPASPTVIGVFRVYMKTPGVNAKGMVHSSYFIRGYAVHGYASVPPFPASHGCLRIPIADARFVFDWLRVGDRVFVYP